MRVQLLPPRRVAAGTLMLRGTARVRQAVRIALCDEQGTCGWGEALPLPGYSRDDAEIAFAVLNEWVDVRWDVPTQAHGITQIAAALAPFDSTLVRSPSAGFALECALLDLLSRRAGQSAAAWLAQGRVLQPVPVSVLLPDDEAGAIIAAGDAARRGHTVLKLKVARADRSAAQELAWLAAVRAAADAAAPGKVKLRLDANGAIDPATLQQRLAEWAAFGVELLEEPLAGDALLNLPPLSLPWAADESLQDPQRAAALLALPPGRGPAAGVLKPAMLGLVRAMSLAQAAASRGLGVIVTHSLDGDLGHAAACALAQALPSAPWPCGLAAHPGLVRRRDPGVDLAMPACPGLGLEGWR